MLFRSKQRDATIAANSAEIERISSAFSRVQNELKEHEAQLTESQQQHERNIEHQRAEIRDLKNSVEIELRCIEFSLDSGPRIADCPCIVQASF